MTKRSKQSYNCGLDPKICDPPDTVIEKIFTSYQTTKRKKGQRERYDKRVCSTLLLLLPLKKHHAEGGKSFPTRPLHYTQTLIASYLTIGQTLPTPSAQVSLRIRLHGTTWRFVSCASVFPNPRGFLLLLLSLAIFIEERRRRGQAPGGHQRCGRFGRRQK